MTDSPFRKWLGRTLLAMLLAGSACAMAADPLVLFLLRALRDQVVMSAAEAAFDAASRPAPPRYGYLALPQDAPAAAPEDQRLKAVIDRSFTYLSAAQREQIHDGLMKILSDPQNAALRPQIVESFTRTAEAVRVAQQTFERLSTPEKRALVAQARGEYVRLGPQERQQMLDILRAGHVPFPRDLTEMMVAEFSTVQAGGETPRVQ